MWLLGVSRTTLREALRGLQQQRLIVRRRGLGAFVAKPPMMKDPSMNFGISAMIKPAGYVLQVQKATIRREGASIEYHVSDAFVFLLNRNGPY